MKFYSIFNDVIGPIMSGPSSSHSAGCARIGKTTRLLCGKEIRKARVVFDKNGSYPTTYIGQGSNFGFTGGLMGFSTDDIRLKDAVEIARDSGIDISFAAADLGSHHPNEAKIEVFGENGEPDFSVLTYSTGGGTFEIKKLDEFAVHIDGKQNLSFLCVKPERLAAFSALLEECGVPFEKEDGNGRTLLIFQNSSTMDEKLSQQEFADFIFFRKVHAILPVPVTGSPCFYTAKEALEYAAAQNIDSLWKLAVAYERSISGLDEKEIFALAQKCFDIMLASTVDVDPDTTPKFGFSEYSSLKIKEKMKQVPLIGCGVLEQAMAAAITVMENSCAHNRVVAAPTAGSSGVLPGAVLAIGGEMGKSREEILQALLASGLIGVFIANQATFGAEVAGCQAENGAASAMAAGGLIQLLSGTVAEGFNAAGLALQNMLGLICDPIAGMTEIPCISRNVSAIANAVISANMIRCGFNPYIPLDEVIAAMLKVGSQLPSELRCTCHGGLCTTPTGIRLNELVTEKYKDKILS